MHFSVLVLTQVADKPEAVDRAVELMVPFDENLERDEHIADCPCIGWAARVEARREAAACAEDLGIDGLREKMNDLQHKIVEASGGEAMSWQPAEQMLGLIMDASQRKSLGDQMHAIKSKIEEVQTLSSLCQQEAERLHPEYGKADPDCEVCEGMGVYFTTANEQGRWDWFEIGGRWTGVLDPEYDPSGDLRNYSDCDYCGQTGIRWWRECEGDEAPGMLGQRLVPAGHPEYAGETAPDGFQERTCNGCQGTGTSRNFHNAPFEGDVMAVAHLPEAKMLCGRIGSVVDDEGCWHDSDGLSDEQWMARLEELFAQHIGGTAVVVDCHC